MYFSAIGQDSHRFVAAGIKKTLVLGGVKIPGAPGLEGNSDADVVLHALCNALSGLSGIPVLGTRTDTLCNEQGVTDSKVYVREALATLQEIKLIHVSISIEACRPHLSKYNMFIRQSLAELLALSIEHVALTATSGEGLTAFGRGEGIMVIIIASGYKAGNT